MVWATSNKVGCAVHFCPEVTGFGRNAAHFICNYGPRWALGYKINYKNVMQPRIRMVLGDGAGNRTTMRNRLTDTPVQVMYEQVQKQPVISLLKNKLIPSFRQYNKSTKETNNITWEVGWGANLVSRELVLSVTTERSKNFPPQQLLSDLAAIIALYNAAWLPGGV